MHENGHNNYVMFMFIQLLGKYQFKDMDVYIEPLIDKLLNFCNGITMYDIDNFNFMQCLYGQYMMPLG